ncbi:hypothetical protein [Thalassospira alkalitolerans]|uniref:hypothetical protein n=1 Tax=Thalassospira alkalitolerans TaxID=1293890 RepID=UPI003AA7E368
MRFLYVTVTIVMVSFIGLVGSNPSQAETMSAGGLTFPVRDADMSGVVSCYRGQNAFCDRCEAPNINNVSLANYTILRHALTIGGVTAPLVPVASPNSERSRMMIASGKASIKSDWTFNIDGNKAVLKSVAFIENGEIEKGIFGRADNVSLAAVRHVDDLKGLRAVMNRNWRLDWQVLEELAPGQLLNAATSRQIFNLIDQRRADFTLLEFSAAADKGREIDGIRLVPVPGIKVALPGSQHFMISRRLPNAKDILDRLNTGIEALRANGFIRKCLIQSGIFNARVAYWSVINTEQLHGSGIPSH